MGDNYGPAVHYNGPDELVIEADGTLTIRGAVVGMSRNQPYFVDTVNGSDANNGKSWAQAKATMAAALALVGDHGVIGWTGDVREQLNGPLGVQGVRIIASNGGNTRHDDGARWRTPASGAVAATPLLTLREQGWEVIGGLFVPDANAVTGVRIRRAEDATWPDGSHSKVIGSKFIGVDGAPVGTGVEDHGGAHHVIVEGCEFHGLVDGIKHTVGAGIASPLRWDVRGNFFENNTNHFTLPANASRFRGNILDRATTTMINTSGGTAGGNFVLDNYVEDNEADIDNAHGYTGHASDAMWRIYSKNTAAMTVGIPGA